MSTEEMHEVVEHAKLLHRTQITHPMLHAIGSYEDRNPHKKEVFTMKECYYLAKFEIRASKHSGVVPF